MSITITTDVFCDVCETAWVHGITGLKAGIRCARRRAKERGWNRHRLPISGKMIDVCPECFEERQRQIRANIAVAKLAGFGTSPTKERDA